MQFAQLILDQTAAAATITPAQGDTDSAAFDRITCAPRQDRIRQVRPEMNAPAAEHSASRRLLVEIHRERAGIGDAETPQHGPSVPAAGAVVRDRFRESRSNSDCVRIVDEFQMGRRIA